MKFAMILLLVMPMALTYARGIDQEEKAEVTNLEKEHSEDDEFDEEMLGLNPSAEDELDEEIRTLENDARGDIGGGGDKKRGRRKKIWRKSPICTAARRNYLSCMKGRKRDIIRNASCMVIVQFHYDYCRKPVPP